MLKAFAWSLPAIPLLLAIVTYLAVQRRWPKSWAMFLLFFADNPILWAVLIVLAQEYADEALIRPLLLALAFSVLCGTFLYVKLRSVEIEEGTSSKARGNSSNRPENGQRQKRGA
jgi:hypothetical protein